jgi:hypothetical protein
MSEKGYESPEAAALAEWDQYRNAEVRVVEVRFTDAKNAVVVTDTEPSHPMKNYVTLTDDGWVFTADHN